MTLSAGSVRSPSRIAVLGYSVGEREIAPTTTFGLAAGAVWEFIEWVGLLYVPQFLHVGHADTIS